MKRITFDNREPEQIIRWDDAYEGVPIFVKKDGRLVGMVVKIDKGTYGIYLGGSAWSNGDYHKNAESAMKASKPFGYTYHIED